MGYDGYGKPWPTAGPSSIYVEVGTNIGACVMDMLMHTDANIVAWEPAPKNLFVLTSTLMQLEEKYRKRVALFPVGAGDVDMASVIYAKVDNMGHSVVGKPVDDDPTTPNHFLVSTAHTHMSTVHTHTHTRGRCSACVPLTTPLHAAANAGGGATYRSPAETRGCINWTAQARRGGLRV
jgi:hypothetical protein